MSDFRYCSKLDDGNENMGAELSVEGKNDLNNPVDIIFNWCNGFAVPHWIEDKSCYACSHCGDKLKSGSTHNCRLCGFVYCSRCTSKLNVMARFELKDKVGASRVCYGCKFRCLSIRDLNNGLHTTRFTNLFSIPKDIGYTKQACQIKIKSLEEFTAKYLQGEVIYAPEKWQDSSDYSGSCPKCRARVRHSKHNCRLCGYLYCEDCAEKMNIDLPPAFNKKGKAGPQRICDECRYRVLAGGILSASPTDCNASPTPVAATELQTAVTRGIPALGFGASVPTLEQIREAKSRLKSHVASNEFENDRSPRSIFDEDQVSCTTSAADTFLKVRLRKHTDFKAITAFTVPLLTLEPLPSPLATNETGMANSTRLDAVSAMLSGSTTPRKLGSSTKYHMVKDGSPLPVARRLSKTFLFPSQADSGETALGAADSANSLRTVPLSDEDHSLSYSVIQGGIEKKMQPEVVDQTASQVQQQPTPREVTLLDFHRRFVLRKLPRILAECEELRVRSVASASDSTTTKNRCSTRQPLLSDVEIHQATSFPIKIEESEWKQRIEKMSRKCDEGIAYFDQKGSLIERSSWANLTLRQVAGDTLEVLFNGPFDTSETCGAPPSIWTDDENSLDALRDLSITAKPSPRSIRPVAMLASAPKVPTAVPLSPSFSGFDSPSLLSPRGTSPKASLTLWSSNSPRHPSSNLSLTTSQTRERDSSDTESAMLSGRRRGALLTTTRKENRVQTLRLEDEESDECENTTAPPHIQPITRQPSKPVEAKPSSGYAHAPLKLSQLQQLAKGANVEMTTLTPRAKSMANTKQTETNL